MQLEHDSVCTYCFLCIVHLESSILSMTPLLIKLQMEPNVCFQKSMVNTVYYDII